MLSRQVSGGMASWKQCLVPVGLATSGGRATILAYPQVKGAWIMRVLPHGGIATDKGEKLCKAVGLAQGRGCSAESWGNVGRLVPLSPACLVRGLGLGRLLA